jgi:hypothetical protein
MKQARDPFVWTYPDNPSRATFKRGIDGTLHDLFRGRLLFCMDAGEWRGFTSFLLPALSQTDAITVPVMQFPDFSAPGRSRGLLF